MTRTPGPRARKRSHFEAEIVRLGRRQLGEVGAAALSLRQIARELGMASSAVYQYVASRDELLTRLIVESYESLAASAAAAEAAVDRADLAGRWDAIAAAVRAWGRANPYDWALLYGSPVPGYDAPGERTTESGTRVQALLIALLVDIVAAGDAVGPAAELPVPAGAATLGQEVLAAFGYRPDEVSPELAVRAVVAWTLLVAAVSSEVFGHLGEVPDADALFAFTSKTALGLVFTPRFVS